MIFTSLFSREPWLQIDREAGQSAPNRDRRRSNAGCPDGRSDQVISHCLAFDCLRPSRSPHFSKILRKKCARRTADACKYENTVQASASPGGEIALGHALFFDKPCSNHRVMSPSLCGSDPYPCGSLTYRTHMRFCNHYISSLRGCQPPPGNITPCSQA